jgi:hypothetical protein
MGGVIDLSRTRPPASDPAAALITSHSHAIENREIEFRASRFGVTPLGWSAHHQGPLNPHNTSHYPGGSSSGSAVAVALVRSDCRNYRTIYLFWIEMFNRTTTVFVHTRNTVRSVYLEVYSYQYLKLNV